MKKIIGFILAVILTISGSFYLKTQVDVLMAQESQEVKVTVTTPAPTIEIEPYDAEDVFIAINEWRVVKGLKPNTKSKTACDVANARLPEVINNFSHDGFQSVVDKYEVGVYLSENLAQGQYRKEDIIGQWDFSKTHNEIMRTNLPYLCVATDGSVTVAIWSSI